MLVPLAEAHLDLVLLFCLAAVTVFLIAAYHSNVPYPILLVLGGVALGFVPGLPDVTLDPDVVLILALPPLLYGAAFFSSLRDLRDNVREISLLSIGLVIVTMLAVAVVAHAVVGGMSWEAAFVLGAVVSPTDPVAATAIASRLGAPRRYVTIVEGEALVNDATALVAFKAAIAAAVSGSFSLLDASGTFVFNALAGVAIGLAVGWCVAFIRRRIDDAQTEISISLVTAYFAYLPAEALGVSAVLAAVTTGIYMGWHAPELTTPDTRIRSFSVWELFTFVLNAGLFVLVGLQLPSILDGLEGVSASDLLMDAAAVSATVILVRLVWVFTARKLARVLWRRVREAAPPRPWRESLLVGWTGMRGAVSLAAALAVPVTLDSGAPFPDRDLIVFLTYAVILCTLVLQGLTLPKLIARLDLGGEGSEEQREATARLLAARAAIDRINELAGEDWVREDTAERLRNLYEYRVRRFSARFDERDDGGIERRSQDYQRLRREVLEAERAEIIGLRNRGRIDDEIMHRIERDLDLEDTRLEV